MTLTETQNLFNDKRVNAMLKVIRRYEASDRYNNYVGGLTFNSYAAHPYPGQINFLNPTTAAGAYQFVKKTWESIKTTLKLPDFGIRSQDLAATYNLATTAGALKYIQSNQPDKAMDALKGQWEIFTQDHNRAKHLDYYNTIVGNPSNASNDGTTVANVLFFTNGATSDISQQLKNDLNKAARDIGIKKITIRFSRNGGHSANSRHKKGQAVDIQYIDDQHVGLAFPAGNASARRLITALGNYGYRVTTSESGTPKAIIYMSAEHYDHMHVSNNGSVPDDKNDVIGDNGASQNTPEQELSKADLKANLDAIQANVDASELDNVDVIWGMRNSIQEQSDWIGLRQFLLYLNTTYYPKTMVPFVELIPIFLLDESVPNSNQATSPNEYQFTSKEVIGLNKTRNKITQLNGLDGIDLMSSDPFQDSKDFGKNRNLGYKIFGNVVLNPSFQNEETSKAGSIGFQSIEIQSGLDQQQGLSLITINLLDVQGNKFLDITSPWAFILNAPQVKGDFYFRYGWQLEIPPYTSEKAANKNSSEYKFWNHPGWKVFAKGSDLSIDKLKQIISSRAMASGNVLSFTQLSTLDSIFYPGFSINKDKTTGLNVFSIDRKNQLNTNYYWIISMINPEISVDSQDGSLTASIQFRMNNAMANCMCPLSAGEEMVKLVAEIKDGETDLFTLLSTFLKDNKVFMNNDEKLKNYRDDYIDPDRTNVDDWIVVNSLSNNGMRVEPRSIKIKFPGYIIQDLNNSKSSKNTNLTLRAWLNQVCELNFLTLISMGDQGIQTTNQSSGFVFLFDDVQAGFSLNSIPASNFAGDGFFGYDDITRLATQDDVFSFRFRGSLVESIKIQKNDNPNAQTINSEAAAAESGVGPNDVVSGGVTNNDPNNTGNENQSQNSITWNNKKRLLHMQLTKIGSATISCIGHPWIKLGYPVYIKGMNYFDGKYMVSRVKHAITNDGKFTSEIDTVRVFGDSDYANKQRLITQTKKLSLEYGKLSGYFATNTGLQFPTERDIINSYRTPSQKANDILSPKKIEINNFVNLQDNVSQQQQIVPIKKG